MPSAFPKCKTFTSNATTIQISYTFKPTQQLLSAFALDDWTLDLSSTQARGDKAESFDRLLHFTNTSNLLTTLAYSTRYNKYQILKNC
jgi:hypothetical protein